MKRVVATAQVMLDQRIEAAVVKARRDLAKGLQVDLHLIEPAANALPVLRHEAGQTTAGNRARYKHYPVEQPAE
jgi:hypothetical protein